MGRGIGTMRMMIFLDPPDHTVLRTLVSRAFTPGASAGSRTTSGRSAPTFSIRSWRARASTTSQDFAAQLPSRVISSLVGVPPEDQESARQLVEGMFHIEPGKG